MNEWDLCICLRRDAQTTLALKNIYRLARVQGGGMNVEFAQDGYHVDVWGPLALRQMVAVEVEPLLGAQLVLERRTCGRR